jgi:tetratricopeptide (TPR) repeat protein
MLNNLGTLEQDQCSHTAAYILYRESLALMQELEEQRGIAIALNNLGEIEIARGDYKVAQEFLQRSLALRQTIGNKRGTSEALMNLGMVANGQGDYVLAQDLYQQSVVTFQTINDKFSIALNLEKFAHLAYAQNHLERAIRLFGAAEALREIIGSPIAPSDRPNYDRTISALRTTLGEETFAKHWAEGRSMTMEQAIAYALNENEDFSNDSPSTSLEQ